MTFRNLKLNNHGVEYVELDTIQGRCGSCGETTDIYPKKGYCRECYYRFYKDENKYNASEVRILGACAREDKIQEERDNWSFN